MVCVSVEGENPTAAGPNPLLAANLPGWLIEEARRRRPALKP